VFKREERAAGVDVCVCPSGRRQRRRNYKGLRRRSVGRSGRAYGRRGARRLVGDSGAAATSHIPSRRSPLPPPPSTSRAATDDDRAAAAAARRPTSAADGF